MKMIRVTGGFSDYARGLLTEVDRADLHGAQMRLALIGEAASLPDRTDVMWQTPSKIRWVTDWQVELSLLVDETIVPGNYYLWALPIDTPTATPVRGSDHLIVVT